MIKKVLLNRLAYQERSLPRQFQFLALGFVNAPTQTRLILILSGSTPFTGHEMKNPLETPFPTVKLAPSPIFDWNVLNR